MLADVAVANGLGAVRCAGVLRGVADASHEAIRPEQVGVALAPGHALHRRPTDRT